MSNLFKRFVSIFKKKETKEENVFTGVSKTMATTSPVYTTEAEEKVKYEAPKVVAEPVKETVVSHGGEIEKPAKKASVKKTTAKKTTTKKTTTKKAATKKVEPKKSATKKTTVKKPAVKKTTAKKTTVKKVTTKKNK